MKIQSAITWLALLAGLGFSAEHPSFSGTYLLDRARSTGVVPSYSSLSIGQNEHWFRVAQLDQNGPAERTVESECEIDGRFHPVQGGNGGSIRCKWDGSTLVTEKHWDNNRNQQVVRTTRTSDGKLVQDIHFTSPPDPATFCTSLLHH